MYGGFNLLNKAVPFLLLPVFTRYLSPEDYGMVAIFQTVILIAAPFVGFYSAYGIGRVYFSPDTFVLDEYVATVAWITAVSAVILCACVYPFLNMITAFLKFPSRWIFGSLVVAIATSTTYILLVLWQAQIKPIQTGVYQSFFSFSEILLAVYVIVFLGLGWRGRVISNVALSLLSLVCTFFILYRNGYLSCRFRWGYAKHALCYGIPILLATLAALINSTVDRLFIVRMQGMAEAGVYSIAVQISLIIAFIGQSVNQAYQPWLFKGLSTGSNEDKRKIVIATYLCGALFLFLSGMLAVISPLLLKIMVAPPYWRAAPFAMLLCFANAFYCIGGMGAHFLLFQERPSLLAGIVAFGALLNFPLNYIFISLYGTIGAAIATCCAQFAVLILSWYSATHYVSMPWFSFNTQYRG